MSSSLLETLEPHPKTKSLCPINSIDQWLRFWHLQLVSLGLNLYLELWSPESCLISLWLSVLTVKPESQSYRLKIFLLFGLNKVIKVHSITVIVGMAQYNVGQTFAITMCVKAMLLPSHMLTRIFPAQPWTKWDSSGNSNTYLSLHPSYSWHHHLYKWYKLSNVDHLLSVNVQWKNALEIKPAHQTISPLCCGLWAGFVLWRTSPTTLSTLQVLILFFLHVIPLSSIVL